MNNKKFIYKAGSDAVIQKYSLFLRSIYDKSEEKYKIENPTEWRTDLTGIKGLIFKLDLIIHNIDLDYDLYAIWPDLFVKIVYNYPDREYELEKIIIGDNVIIKTPIETGFACWLDVNGILHFPGETILMTENVNLYLSSCYDISVSYDLNGGTIDSGKKIESQATKYSRWKNIDGSIGESLAVILIAADNPSLGEVGVFNYWKIENKSYHKGDILYYSHDLTAQAQWLYNHTYTLKYECKFDGVAPDEQYGSILILLEQKDNLLTSRIYKATPLAGFLLNRWEHRQFNGTSWSLTLTIAGSNDRVEVTLNAIGAAKKKLDLVDEIKAYFYYDSSYTLVYDKSDNIIKRARIIGLATNSNLGVSGSSNVKKIIFYDQVTSIGEKTFLNCLNLDTISMNNVVSIGNNAFLNTGFTSIDFIDNLTTISKAAFYGCKKASSVEFGKNLLLILEKAFSSSNLVKVDFDNVKSNYEICDEAFSNINSLTAFTFSLKNTKTGKNIFSGCSSLKEITISLNTLDAFDDEALKDSSILSINLTTIESNLIPFDGDDPLDRITVTISFNGNDSTGGTTESISTKLKNQWTCPDCSFTKTGYEFNGYWTSNADGTGDKYYPGLKYLSSKNTTIYANWKEADYYTKAIVSISELRRPNCVKVDKPKIVSMLHQSGITDEFIYDCTGEKCTSTNILNSIEDALNDSKCNLLLFIHLSHGGAGGTIELTGGLLDSTRIYEKFANSKSYLYIFASYSTCYAEAQFRYSISSDNSDIKYNEYGELMIYDKEMSCYVILEKSEFDFFENAQLYFSLLSSKLQLVKMKINANKSNGLFSISSEDSKLLSLNANPNLLCWGACKKNQSSLRLDGGGTRFYDGLYKNFNSEYTWELQWNAFSTISPAAGTVNGVTFTPVKNSIGTNFEDRKIFTLEK